MQGLGFGPAPSPGAQTLQDLFGLDAAGQVRPAGNVPQQPQPVKASDAPPIESNDNSLLLKSVIDERFERMEESRRAQEGLMISLLDSVNNSEGTARNVKVRHYLGNIQAEFDKELDAARQSQNDLFIERVTKITDGINSSIGTVFSEMEEAKKQFTVSEARHNQDIQEILNKLDTLPKPPEIGEIVKSVKSSLSGPAPKVTIDEATLRRIADEAASRTADRLSVISQEVIQRDDKGRASIIQRITADNNTSYYQVNRNEAGGVESMTRVNVTT